MFIFAKVYVPRRYMSGPFGLFEEKQITFLKSLNWYFYFLNLRLNGY